MSTMVCWFASVAQARDAVLDLLTSGIPRQDIGVVISAPLGEQDGAARSQSQIDAGDTRDVLGDSQPRDFVEALAGADTFTPPDVGRVVAAGPLADVLVSSSDGTAGGGLVRALIAIGIAGEQAQKSTEQLHNGGALVAVLSDDSWDTVVSGVFRHNADPTLREQEELVGPGPGREATAEEDGEPLSASIGALTGGTIPGSWGAAGAIFEDQVQDRAGDEERRDQPGE